MMTRAALAALPFLLAASAGAQTVRVDTADAPSIGHRVEYRVVLPPAYDSTRRYPVLWLLHGYGGGDQDWLRNSGLLRDLGTRELIVVLPGVGNSWYVNAVNGGARWEDFMTRDLPVAVRARYAIDTLHQAVAGLSMGGYGAMMLALRHPGRYRAAGALSGAISVTHLAEPAHPPEEELHIDSVFGARGSAERDAYDVLRLVHVRSAPQLPYFYLAIGTRDAYTTFLPANRAFTDSLRTRGTEYEYHEVPGGHSWRLWDAQLAPMLESIWRELTIDLVAPRTR